MTSGWRLEAANQQEFITLPPKSQDNGSSYFLVRTRCATCRTAAREQLNSLFDRELIVDRRGGEHRRAADVFTLTP